MSMETPVIYFALDVERATGIENLLPHYAIVTPWESEMSGQLESQGTRLFVLERDCKEFSEERLWGGTYEIMKLPCVKNFIDQFSKGAQPSSAQGYGGAQPNILVLKNSELIENECTKNGWKLLAPEAHAAKLFEDKITQWQLLHETVEFPETIVTDVAHAAEESSAVGFPLVMQFNAGHSGGGTHVMKSVQDFAPFEKQFPQRQVRMAKYLKGITYTLNALVLKEGNVYTGSISKQLTGLKEATANPSSTVGNDFGAAAEELFQKQGESIADMARVIGRKMHEMGYAGLFGIDIVVEETTGKLYCIEVNTHQPASIPFEAKLHQMIGKTPIIFLWIRDMIEDSLQIFSDELPPLFLKGDARQIIYRNKTDEVVSSDSIAVPENALISRMKQVKPNEELFRVQTYDIIQ